MRARFGSLALTLLLASCAAAPKPAAVTPAPAPGPQAESAQPLPSSTPAALTADKPPKPPPLSLEAAAAKADARLQALARREKKPGAAPETQDLQVRYEALLDLPGTPAERKPEILLRLAELAYREEEMGLRGVYEGREAPPPASGSRYPKAIGYYRKLVDAYPDSPQALTAFYNLGYLYAEEGKGGLSAWAYEQVLQRDPKTRYADEIHMRLGEAAFDGGEMDAAIAHYRAVVVRGNPEYVDKALYKIGWSFYNLNDFSKAVDAFAKVLDPNAGTQENLRRETLEVMARAFVEWGGLAGAGKFLAAAPQSAQYGDRLYRLLGDLYTESSRYDDAVKAYAAGVENYPTSADCLSMEKGILSALLTLRDLEGANGRREAWVQQYGPGSPWERANPGEKLAAERSALLEEGLRLAAIYRHSQAQRGEGNLGRALDLYARYLQLFREDTEERYEVSYAHAQALKEAGKLREAEAQYRAVAELPARSSHREEASYRRIEVLQALYAKDPSAFGALAAAYGQYARLNPSSAQVPQVLFAQGELYFGAERFAEAREAYARVSQSFPDEPQGKEALERIARSLFREGQYAQAEAAARKALVAHPAAEVADRASKLLAFAVFKQGEELETSGDRPAANAQFFRVADELPESEVAQVALYRAAENLSALGKDAEAAKVYARLARTYRGSKYAKNALSLSAQILSSLGDMREAARSYEELYRSEPEGDGAVDALFQAASACEKAGDLEGAARLFGELAGRFPQDPRRIEVRFREAQALRALGRKEEASAGYRSVWESRSQDRPDIFPAQAALALGDLSLEEFRKVEIRGNLEEALSRKEALLDQALEHLARAASLPFAETLTGALFRAGRSYEEMKEAILGSERPADLTPEEREQYDFLLEEKAAPLEEKAIDYYRKGVAASRQAGIHTVWVDRMYERLEALVPWAYQRTEETTAAFVLPSLPRAPAPARGDRP